MNKKTEEKHLIIEVKPKESDFKMVQTMLSTMLADETIVHEKVAIEFGNVVSKKMYKGLCYGRINDSDLDEMRKREHDGFERKHILCMAEMHMAPCIVSCGSWGEPRIEAHKKYVFKIKLVYSRYTKDAGITNNNAKKKNIVAAPF